MPGWGLTVLLAEAIGSPARTRDERHRQLPRRADRAGVGTGEPRGPARGAAAVHADSSRSTWRRTTPPACATCSRPTARRNGSPTTRPGASSCGVRRTGWRRRAASPTRSPSVATRSWRAVARSRAERMAVTPFRIAVPDAELDDLHAAIARTRWPSEVDDAGWDYGTPLGFLQELVEYWADEFDWRRREELLNSLPQFRTTADAPGFEQFGLHFVHQPGRRARSAAARAQPRMAEHALRVPGRRRCASRTRGRSARTPLDAFHVVVPSLPGYGFSDIPTRRGMTPHVMSTMFAALMRELGVRPLRRRRVRLGCVRDRAARSRPPRRARRDPHGDAQLPPRPTTNARPKMLRSRAGQGLAQRGVRLQHHPGHQAAVVGLRADGLARRARGMDRGEVATLVRLRRRRAASLHPRRAAHHDRHLLVRRHDQQRQPPVLREPARPGRRSPRRAGPAAGRLPARARGRRCRPPTSARRPGPGPRRSTTCSAGRSPTAGLHFPAAETPDLYVEELRAFFRHLR